MLGNFNEKLGQMGGTELCSALNTKNEKLNDGYIKVVNSHRSSSRRFLNCGSDLTDLISADSLFHDRAALAPNML